MLYPEKIDDYIKIQPLISMGASGGVLGELVFSPKSSLDIFYNFIILGLIEYWGELQTPLPFLICF